MIRAAAPLAIVAAAACAGPSSPVPTGFENNCVSGPRIIGESKMGMTNDGLSTDTDAKIVMTGRAGGGCTGAAFGIDR